MTERIPHQRQLPALIPRASYTREGIRFLTPENFSQQLGYMKRPAA